MWQKSSYCKADSPMCVEVGGLEFSTIYVRNSKEFGPPVLLSFTREEWAAFIEGAKAGEFDLRTDTTSDAEEMMDQV